MIIESKNLRKLRYNKKLTQQEIADLLNISQPTYCSWETKDSDIKLENVIQLTKIFDVKIEELIPNNCNLETKHINNLLVNNDIEKNKDDIYTELILSLKEQIKLLQEIIMILQKHKE